INYGGNSGDVNNYQTGGFYPASSLFRTQQIDENGNPTTTFTDKIGQLILTRKTVDGQQVNTYNRYDNRGNLITVYPPEYETNNDPIFNYNYGYDPLNRLTQKNLPDGVVTNYTYYPSDLVETQVDNNNNTLRFEYNPYLQPTYTYLQRPEFGENLQRIIWNHYIEGGGPGTGQPEFTEVARLDDYTQLRTDFEYDHFSRLSTVKKDGHLGFPLITQNYYDGGSDRLVFTGQLIDNISLVQFQTYDHAKRLIDTWHNGRLISHNVYNFRDELTKKQLGSQGQDQYLQTVDYQYNVRGWLTHINTLIEDVADQAINECTIIPPVGGDCDNAPMIKISELIKIRLTGDQLNLNCYDPCADTISMCDYTTTFTARFFKHLNEIIGEGIILNLPNYPYVWDDSTSSPNPDHYPGLVEDLQDWLHTNNYFFEQVRLTPIDDINVELKITQTNFGFERINGAEPNGSSPMVSVFNTNNCQGVPIARADLEIQELEATMANTTSTNLNYPTTLYEVILDNDGQRYLLTGEELSIYRGAYEMVQCVPLNTATQTVSVRTDQGTLPLSVGQLLILRKTQTLELVNGGSCGPPPPNLCLVTDTIPPQQASALVFYDSAPNYAYFSSQSYNVSLAEDTFNTFNFVDTDLTADALGEYTWDLGLPLPAEATLQSYKVQFDHALTACKLSHIALHDGDNFVSVNGGLDTITIDSLGQLASGTFELIPDQLPSPEQLATLRLVYFNGCTSAQIQQVRVIVEYMGLCPQIPFCTPPAPSCSPAEAAHQKMLIATIRDTMQNLVIEHLPMPNSLNRVFLCDGTELYLFEHELAILQGQYTILQSILINSPDDEVSIRTEGDDVADVFAMRLYYQEGKDDLTRNMEGAPQRNGNISNIYWQANGAQVQRYGYTYDQLDRLKQATYADLRPDKFFATDNKYSVSGINYDRNGNLLSLVRRGPINQCPSPNQYGFVDLLNYKEYTGNRLTEIWDAVPNHGGVRKDEIDLNYDDNGNLISHTGKGINLIEYNYLNLPKKVIFGSESKAIQWVYDAQGNKLRKQLVENDTITSTKDYFGPVEYVNGSLDMIYHPEGRVMGGQYEYVIKDHLGNSRVHFRDLNWDGWIRIGGAQTEVT
ncbi:MAG: hypothetical protein AAGD05_07090, partial [Bacteroidota bacterium]